MDKRCVLCGVLAIASGIAARADEITLIADRDNTLYEDALGGISNGQGEGFFAGVNGAMHARRGLLRFDLSAIPIGSTVTSVVLTLHLSRGQASQNPVALHRALRSWGEGASNAGLSGWGVGGGGAGAPALAQDATWLHTFFSTQFWIGPGGLAGADFIEVPSAAATVGSGSGFISWGSSPGLVTDAQIWHRYPTINFGWFVLGDESASGTAKRFDTRECIQAAFRPRLVITYTPPCYPNCDQSTTLPVLNANDFNCFLNAFAAQDLSANCDESTTIPVLNANDFNCFLNAFAAGCP